MNHHNFSHTPRAFKQPMNNFHGGALWNPRHQFNQHSYPPYLRPPVGMTPEGLCLPTHMQPPPMFGPRGATIPPRMMGSYKKYTQCTSCQKNNFVRHNTHVDNFWCETCDKGFKSSEILEKHQSEHQKCGIDGCQFVAHPNVVTKHIQMQHSSGLYNKIRNISTPEDIANWIKERKKNYPSKENIEKRRAQQKECHERGEKLQHNKSRFNNGRKNNDNLQYNNRNKRKDKPMLSNSKANKTNNFPKMSISVTASTKKVESEPVEELYCNLKKFRGTSELVRHDLINDFEAPIPDGIDIEDEEWEEAAVQTEIMTTDATVCSALGYLINAYDTSSDDDDDDDDPSIKKGKNTVIEKSISYIANSYVCNFSGASNEHIQNISTVNEGKDTCNVQESIHFNKTDTSIVSIENDSGPEEASIEKIGSSQIPDANHPQRQGRKRKHSHSTYDKKNETTDSKNISKKDSNCLNKYNRQYLTKRTPYTLLEKLLENDIRHERNYILQCIRHVIKNNYFNK